MQFILDLLYFQKAWIDIWLGKKQSYNWIDIWLGKKQSYN